MEVHLFGYTFTVTKNAAPRQEEVHAALHLALEEVRRETNPGLLRRALEKLPHVRLAWGGIAGWGAEMDDGWKEGLVFGYGEWEHDVAVTLALHIAARLQTRYGWEPCEACHAR